MPGPIKSPTLRGWRAALIFASAVLMAGWLYRHFSVNRDSAIEAGGPILAQEPMKIAPGIYLLGGLSPSVVYVIETFEGFVLIDSGLQSDAGALKSEMGRLGLDWKRVRAILLTHAHGDHCGGAEALRDATGAKIYAGEKDAPILRAGEPREAFFSFFDMPGETPHPVTVDVSLKGGETLEFANIIIKCIATPGHTPGSMCFMLHMQNIRALFSGDVIMMLVGDDNPRNDLRKPLGTYPAYMAPRYRGSAGDCLDSLRRLRALPVPDLVLPGHPGADIKPQSPHLSQARWESLLDGGIHDMEVLQSRFASDGAAFLDGIPKQLLPDMYYLGDFRGTAVYGFFTGSQLFLIDAPGGPGLVEFVSNRLRELGRKPVAPTMVFLTGCGPQETAGLTQILEKWHPRVVASPAGLERLRTICPAGTVILSALEMFDQRQPAILAIPLVGRGIGPMAYQLDWAGKTVVFSGRIPVKMSTQSSESLSSDFVSGNGNAHSYLESVAKLQRLTPRLWLPAVPIHGQNANLYDKEWEHTIEDNISLVQYLLSRNNGSRASNP